MRLRENRPPWILLLLAALFVTWSALYVWRNSFVAIDGHRYFASFDDALISMRYAWNLAHGNGLVWNPGERVEGFTSLLMTLGMSIVQLVADKRLAALIIQVAGVGTVVATAALSGQLYRGLRTDLDERMPIGVAEALVFAGVLLNYPLVYWSLMGMETGLLTLLLTFGAVRWLRFEAGQETVDLWAGTAALALAYLCRPDAILYILLLLGYLAMWLWSRRPGRRVVALLASAALAIGVVVLGQTVFRWLYYGALVPNTYVLKVEGFPLPARIQNGWVFVAPYFIEYVLLLVLALAGALLSRSRPSLLVIGWIGVSIAYQVWIGGDAWRLWRFLTPAFPFLLAAFVGEAGALGSDLAAHRGELAARYRLGDTLRLGRWRVDLRSALAVVGVVAGLLALVSDPMGLSDPGWGSEQSLLLIAGLVLVSLAGAGFAISRLPWSRGARATALGLALFVAAQVQLDGRFLPEISLATVAFDIPRSQDNINIALAVREVTEDAASVGAFSAGSIPYYSGRYAIDFLGKSDARIARLPADLSGAVSRGSMIAWPGHNKYDLHYSIGVLRPTYVQAFRWGRDNLTDVRDRDYRTVDYRGVSLSLLRDSDLVRWSVVDEP
ncbi:MAG TPA: hypothetical protein VLD63_14745 [Anaerolineales bacterium]|nr:hypothetical protein [Anaerolineales bacterium]